MSREERLLADYQETAAYFRELHETRFRLLALVPLITGAAVAWAPDLEAQRTPLGLLGLLVTLGYTIYDQRNTQIYDRLVVRGKLLERLLEFPRLKLPGREGHAYGGAFRDRPPRRGIRLGRSGKRIELLWHDLGLAIIYSAALGGWAYMAMNGLHWPEIWASVVGVLALIVLVSLAKRNDHESDEVEIWVSSERPLDVFSEGPKSPVDLSD